MANQLRFNDDGKFKIIQFTDLHYAGKENDEDDRKTLLLVDNVIEKENPDLIVYSGDLIWSEGIADPIKSFKEVLDSGAKWGKPFAVIYGNHDAEENVTREALQEVLLEYNLSLAEKGPSEISGVGNYILKIASSASEDIKSLMYFFDSGDYAPKEIGGYGWIKQDQVNWYAKASKRFTQEYGKTLPSLAFFHIPIPEYNEVWQHGHVSGIKKEEVCAPKVNSGLFTAMLENKDIMATFAGHDHDNDYVGKLGNISLCYGRVSGYNTYGELQRGARIIVLSEDERNFETWIRLDDGSVI